jgi:GH25 family lysozyme M1 (1,4-beta-N-acetylmuramidase)
MIHPFYKIAGIDIASHQGAVDFTVVEKKAGFVILRAGVGQSVSMKDSRFKEYMSECQDRNIPWGAYWFWVPEKDPEVQADVFKKMVKVEPPLGTWADIEVNEFTVPKEKLEANLIRFLKACDQKFGRPTGLYTGAGFWNVWVSESKFDKLALTIRKKWVADYIEPEFIATARNPALPNGFPKWDIWQFSAKGNGRGREFGVSSISIDLDVFPGSAEDFKARFGVSPNSIQPE